MLNTPSDDIPMSCGSFAGPSLRFGAVVEYCSLAFAATALALAGLGFSAKGLGFGFRGFN